MSRNLATSSCCKNIVRLSDLRGQPIEFRQYADNPPVLGTRWDCPTCGTAYFAWWRPARWNDRSQDWGSGFVIDLSYYESFNDEHAYEPDGTIDTEHPGGMCEDNADDWQWVW